MEQLQHSIDSLTDYVEGLTDRVATLTNMVTRLLPPDYVGKVTYVGLRLDNGSDEHDPHVNVAGYPVLMFLSYSIGPDPKEGDIVNIWRTDVGTKFFVVQDRAAE